MDELPEGWSWNATRSSPDADRIYSAYCARRGLQTQPSTSVDAVIRQAHDLETVDDKGTQLTLFS